MLFRCQNSCTYATCAANYNKVEQIILISYWYRHVVRRCRGADGSARTRQIAVRKSELFRTSFKDVTDWNSWMTAGNEFRLDGAATADISLRPRYGECWECRQPQRPCWWLWRKGLAAEDCWKFSQNHWRHFSTSLGVSVSTSPLALSLSLLPSHPLFRVLAPRLPLEVGPLKSSYRVWSGALAEIEFGAVLHKNVTPDGNNLNDFPGNQLTKSRAVYTVKANRGPKFCRESFTQNTSDDDHSRTEWICVFSLLHAHLQLQFTGEIVFINPWGRYTPQPLPINDTPAHNMLIYLIPKLYIFIRNINMSSDEVSIYRVTMIPFSHRPCMTIHFEVYRYITATS